MFPTILVAFTAPFFVSCDGPLTLVAIPVEVMEGGPITVHVCVSSRADTPLDLILPSGGSRIRFALRDGHNKKTDLRDPESRLLNSIGGCGRFTLQPGARFICQHYYLHRFQPAIPSGEHTIHVDIEIMHRPHNPTMPARPTKTASVLQVDVLIRVAEATTERITQRRLRVQEVLRSDRLSNKDLEDSVRPLLFSKHAEFIPVMEEMIRRSGLSPRFYRELPESCFLAATDKRALAGHFAKTIHDVHTPAVLAIFELWRGRIGFDLKREEVDCMKRSDNSIVRLLTFVHYPHWHSRDEANALAGHLKVYKEPAVARIDALVGKLDDPSFKERERATIALFKEGEAALPRLRAMHGTAASAEVESRIEQIIKQIEGQAPDPLEESLLNWLRVHPGTETDLVLQVLSKCKSHLWITQQSQKILKERLPQTKE